MKSFDRYLRQCATEKPIEMPDTGKEHISKILSSLPDFPTSPRLHTLYSTPRYALKFAVCTFLTAFLLLPNISPTYARTLENIPIFGDCIQVITIRNYFYEDEHHEMNVAVPAFEYTNAVAINNDIHTLTEELVKRFYEEIKQSEGKNIGSLNVNYETVVNTEIWFTLKLSVHQTAADSSTYFKYYNVDKRTGKIIRFEDLFEDLQYREKIAENIKNQMLKQMQTQEDIIYWLHDPDPEFSFTAEDLSPEHNFYFDSSGNLVIPFDQFEVAPGYMGCPAFVIPNIVTDSLLHDAFVNIP